MIRLFAEGVWNFQKRVRAQVRRALAHQGGDSPSWLVAPHAALVLILAIGFGFYAQTLGTWFFHDDLWFLQASDANSFSSYTLDAFDYRSNEPVPELLYRPLYVVWFYGLFIVFGLNAWAYHLLGVLVHLLSATLLWGIAKKVTGRDAIAHFAALIFVLHPSYAVAVAFVNNNIVVFSTSAYLGSLALFLHYLDGGVRRSWYYAASLLSFLVALLLHPETAQLFAVLVLAFLLLRSSGFREALDLRRWLPFLPFLAVEVGFLGVQALARQAIDYQTTFQLGDHMVDNYVRYAAFAVDPFRAVTAHVPFQADSRSLEGWRTWLPLVVAGVPVFWLLAVSRSRPYVSLFALCWFLLALLPLSTWTFGAVSRKLYVAGPAMGLLGAVLLVTVLDYLADKTPLRFSLMAPLCALIIIIPFGARVIEMTGRFEDEAAGYQLLIDEVRQSDTAIPDGARLYLVGVPWNYIAFSGAYRAVQNSFQLYYGLNSVYLTVTDEQLRELDVPPVPGDIIFHYECPPVCQPPIQ